MATTTTDRLTLRPFAEADIPAYAAIRRKPGVTRFLPGHTGDPAEADRRSAAAVRAFAGLWDDPGYGPWAVVLNGAVIGHGGLRRVDEEDATEVLYLLDPAARGNGYATEVARAALDYGFETLGLDRIVAWAMPENVPSLCVMDRAGLQRRPGTVTVFGIEAVEAAITRDDWAARQRGRR